MKLPLALGVKVEKERKILFIYAITLAALATSVAGNIAFLGLLRATSGETFSGTGSSKTNTNGSYR